jgi:nucleotide-binding universal stress UspA family protein
VNAVEVATELLRGRPTALIQEVLAWTAFGARVLRSRVPEHEFVEYIDAARRAVDDAMQTFTTTHADRLKEVSVQLVQGEPERARSHFIDRNGIDSVVMGTVARAGIRGLVIGNTAERVLQRLRGSVLAVKPPGFVSPVAGFLSRRSRAWMLSVGVRRTSTASDTSCEAKPRASYVGLCIKACSGEPWCVP